MKHPSEHCQSTFQPVNLCICSTKWKTQVEAKILSSNFVCIGIELSSQILWELLGAHKGQRGQAVLRAVKYAFA